MAQSKVLDKSKIDQWRFVLAGRTGSGKSTTGNTILGREAFKACVSGSSVTWKCQREDAIKNGISYVIVDTPGLFDTRLSKMEISKEVVRCVSMLIPGPHLFLLTVNVGRFTKEEIDCFTEIFELFGENLNRYSLIIFTGKDRLKGQSIETFISSCEELKDIVEKCNNNYISINNESEGNELNSEIKLLMQKIHSVIASNQNQHYTNEMFKETELAFERREKELKENAEKKKPEEMRHKTKAHQNVIKDLEMVRQISALKYDKHILQQSAKRDEGQVKQPKDVKGNQQTSGESATLLRLPTSSSEVATSDVKGSLQIKLKNKQAERARLIKEISALECDKRILQQSAKRDEGHVKQPKDVKGNRETSDESATLLRLRESSNEVAMSELIASLQIKLENNEAEHALMVKEILENHEKLVDTNEQNHEDSRSTAIPEYQMMEEINKTIQNQNQALSYLKTNFQELSESNKKLKSDFDKKADKICVLM